MLAWLRDLRYAVRILVKSPIFAVTTIFVLALGIATESAIFAVIDTVLLKPLPFEKPERLVLLWGGKLNSNMKEMDVSFPVFKEWSQQSTSFTATGAFTFPRSIALTGGQYTERVQGSFVTSSFLPLLGVTPVAGRLFTQNEDRRGNYQVVLISYEMWQRLFGKKPEALGQILRLNGVPYTIIGVLPRTFYLGSLSPLHVDIITPLDTDSPAIAKRDNREFMVMGRLKAGASILSAQSELNTIVARQTELYPSTDRGWGVNVQPINHDVVNYWGPSLVFLGVATSFVLLIVTATIIVLLLARAGSRESELVIRTALGGSRTKLLRQGVVEGGVLAILSCALGLLIASVLLRIFVHFSPPYFPRIDEVSISAHTVIGAIVLTVLLALAFGAIPVLRLGKRNIEFVLRSANRTIAGNRHERLHSAFVVVQVSVAVILGIGAGLLLKNFVRLSNINLGYNPTNVFTVRLAPTANGYSSAERLELFYRNAVEKLAPYASPQDITIDSNLPMTSTQTLFFSIPGKPEPKEGEEPFANAHVIGTHYFSTMGVPILRGRDFSDEDSATGARVVIINRTLARRFFGSEDAVGESIELTSELNAESNSGNDSSKSARIVAVVGDTVDWALAKTAPNQIYMPYAQNPLRKMFLAARSTVPPASLYAAVRNIVKEQDPDQPVDTVLMMEGRLAKVIYAQRLNMILAAGLSTIAIILTVLAVYGVLSYIVVNRFREFGIRMALGATRKDILLHMLKRAMALVSLGLLIGFLGSYSLTRLLAALLFEMSPRDPQVTAAILAIVAFVAIVGSIMPAIRAANSQPIDTLRCD
jgi:putative ABC transport system permease protein